MSKCCSKCFNDKLITSYIEKESQEFGVCSFCGNENVKLAEPEDFTDSFEMLLTLYKESNSDIALPLFTLIQKDWGVFSSLEVSAKLVPQIIDYTSGKKYEHIGINEKFVKNIWDEFRKEIKHTNRFFPKSDSLDIKELKAWLQELEISKYPKVLYRARISDDKNQIEIINMGKPPANIATAGRANPYGISYLYMATNKKTAIAEIRPHKGDMITIVQIKISVNKRLADLRNPKNYLSPFLRPEYSIEELFKYIELLHKLGKELSKPILPREANLEYLPIQYLAELIKDSGFDGIIYKSSVGAGDNIALFSDENVEFISCELYEVKNLTFKSFKHN